MLVMPGYFYWRPIPGCNFYVSGSTASTGMTLHFAQKKKAQLRCYQPVGTLELQSSVRCDLGDRKTGG